MRDIPRPRCVPAALVALLAWVGAGGCGGGGGPTAGAEDLPPLPHEEQLAALGYDDPLPITAGPQGGGATHVTVPHDPNARGTGGGAPPGLGEMPPPRPQRPFRQLPEDVNDPDDEYEFLIDSDGNVRVAPIAGGGPEGLPYEATCEYSLFVRHLDQPDMRFMLFAPENLWVTDDRGRTTEFIWPTGNTNPTMQVTDTTISYLQHFHGSFDDPDATAGPVGLDWSLRAEGRDGGVDYLLTATNTGEMALKWIQAVFCMHTLAPQMESWPFHEDKGGQNWVRDGGWKTFPSDQPGQPGQFRDYLFRPELSFIARERNDHAWTMAIGWDRALQLESVAPHCIHANPEFTAVQPGQTVRRRGRILLLEGDKDEALKRFCADFDCP